MHGSLSITRLFTLETAPGTPHHQKIHQLHTIGKYTVMKHVKHMCESLWFVTRLPVLFPWHVPDPFVLPYAEYIIPSGPPTPDNPHPGIAEPREALNLLREALRLVGLEPWIEDLVHWLVDIQDPLLNEPQRSHCRVRLGHRASRK